MPMYNPSNLQAKGQSQYEQLMAQGLPDRPWTTGLGAGGITDLTWTADKQNEAAQPSGYLTFDQASGMSDPDNLLKGFGITDIDDEMRAMVQGFGDQYGWKTSQMKQDMYSGVGQAMGGAGAALGQMREQASSLASQSGLRRGRGGMQSANIYDQYQQGVSGLRQQQQQGVEGLRHQWYDELTGTMAQIKDRQDG